MDLWNLQNSALDVSLEPSLDVSLELAFDISLDVMLNLCGFVSSDMLR